MPTITYFYIFLVALVTSLLLIPPISRLAIGMGILDRPNDRKVHLSGTPRLGGIAIFFAFMLSVFVFGEIGRLERGFLAGAVIIFLVGMADDLVGLTPRYKLLGQVIATATAALIGGFSISSLGNLFGMGEVVLGMFAVPFTVLAVVGVTNAINLLDGLDGLAGGVSTIAAVAIGVLAFNTGNTHLLIMAVALVGAVLGFLKYNSYPASIFMGDAGSLFLGYCMGLFSVMLVAQSNGTIAAAVPLVILAVPVLDTLYVMWMRMKAGENPFLPDNKHIHHRFLDLGVGHKFTVVMVYSFTYIMAVLAWTCHNSPSYILLGMLAFVYTIIYLLLRVLSQVIVRNRQQLSTSNQSLRDTRFYRRLVEVAQNLKTGIKYLIVMALSLSVFVPSLAASETTVICILLLVLSGALVFMTNDWGNRFFLFVLYFDGAFIIYLMENLGRSTTFFTVPILFCSHLIFLILFILIGIKVFLRKRTAEMFNSPIEYLILFIIISASLLPMEFTSRYHLMTVAGKSVILFAGYKLILMRQTRRNRKIIVATLVALLVLAVKKYL